MKRKRPLTPADQGGKDDPSTAHQSHKDPDNHAVKDACEKPTTVALTRKVSSQGYCFSHLSVSQNYKSVVSNEELQQQFDVGSLFVSTGKHSEGASASQTIGRLGELFVYNYLIATHPKSEIVWFNMETESRQPFDFRVVHEGEDKLSSVEFIEVKATKYDDKNVFELSYRELQFLLQKYVNCKIIRVFNCGNPDEVRLEILSNPRALLEQGIVRMCLAI